MVGVTSRQAAQVTLDATLGNINTPSVWIDPHNGQAYYVVTYYDESDVRDMNALAQIPALVTPEAQAGHPRRLRGHRARRRPDRHRARPHGARDRGLHGDRGARRRQRRRRARRRSSREEPRPRTSIKWRWVGEMDLMQTTFAGLGAGARARGHGRLHGDDDPVQVASLAARHALRDPGVASSGSSSRSWRRARGSRSRRSWAS